MRQAIAKADADLFHWRIHVSTEDKGLTEPLNIYFSLN